MRVETSSGLIINNCGGDEGIISTHQSSHIVEPLIAHSLAVLQLWCPWCCRWRNLHLVSHNKFMWRLNSSQYLGWWIRRNVFLGQAVDCCFRFVAALQGEIQDFFETRHWETTPTQTHTPLDWIHDCRRTHRDTVQTLTLSYFSEVETSAAAISSLRAAVKAADLGKRELFGSFLLRVIYEHQLFLVLGIPAMTTMWVGPVCGTDSWHSTLLMSHRPEKGSHLEQILGFSIKNVLFCVLFFGSQLM